MWCSFDLYAQTLLINGENLSGAISVPKKTDTWTFTASQGESILISVGEVFESEVDPGFAPLIELLGPNGVGISSSAGTLAAYIDATASLSGTYTVIVRDGTFNRAGDRTGTYLLRLAIAPEKFVVSANDEGGILSHNSATRGSIDLDDLDLWYVGANAGDNITITIKDVSSNGTLTPWIRLYGPNGVLVGLQSSSAQAQITFRAAESCLYLLVVSDGSGAGEGTGAYELTTTGLSEQGKQLRSQKMSPTSMKVCWPSELAGYVLQQNLVLQSEGWVDVSIAPEDNGLNRTTLIPIEAGTHSFFRLRPPSQ